jgi:DNA-binding NarL/FixJ family response regulator
MIKVDITERCPLLAHGLVNILTSHGFQVIGCRTTATDAFPWRADVFVLDPAAVATGSLAEFVHAAQRVAPVLLLADAADPECYRSTGAAGLVDRHTELDGLLQAVRTVADGGSGWGVPAPEPGGGRPDGGDPALSPREQQVLRQIARGLTHGQVARRLGISPHTVDTYVKRIRSKLDIGNKAELTRAAVLGSYDTPAGALTRGGTS